MKVMVAVILISFLANRFLVRPDIGALLRGLIPHLPEGISIGLPSRGESGVADPMLLIGALLGTTFSVAAALYQGNLVREKGWTIKEYNRGIGDAIAGVAVLTVVSAIIMMTSGTVLRGQPANDISVLATQLRPLLHAATHVLFCVGLLAVATNPFVINAMIGGSILADGLGKQARLSDRWSRFFTVAVLLFGMILAMIVLHTPVKKVDAIIFGQALTVVGNPLMAITILWLANRKDIMGERRNKLIHNILGGIGLLVVVFMAIRVLCLIVIKLT
jgi:Mn2+/Fe2+ NRAMP family transporter